MITFTNLTDNGEDGVELLLVCDVELLDNVGHYLHSQILSLVLKAVAYLVDNIA